MVTSKIIYLIIPIVFLLIVIVAVFSESGQWEDLKEAVQSVIEVGEKVLPDVSIGLKEQKADSSIPAAHSEAIKEFTSVIRGMLGKGKENCFAQYKLPTLGEKGTSLNFVLSGDKTVLKVRGGSGGDLIITDLSTEFSSMVPCVIAGSSYNVKVSDHFFDFFISDDSQKQLISPYYKEVSALTLFDTGGGNRIHVRDFATGVVNNQDHNLDNEGWMFTPDGQHVCFFPTNEYNNADEDGIDEDWFKDGESNSIPNKIKENKLNRCG